MTRQALRSVTLIKYLHNSIQVSIDVVFLSLMVAIGTDMYLTN